MTEPLSADLSDAAVQLAELRHRMKNLLSILTALVSQTLRGGVTVADARELLIGRLLAMGAATDLLLAGAAAPATLAELARAALVQFGGDGERIAIAGPPVTVGAEAAMDLALALHELETNAIKYGALSVPKGRVTLSWETADDGAELRLAWTESGGPPVSPPTRRGFGTRLTSALVGRRVDGVADLDFAPEGVRWTLAAPLAKVGR